jgi:hypothetical protein
MREKRLTDPLEEEIYRSSEEFPAVYRSLRDEGGLIFLASYKEFGVSFFYYGNASRVSIKIRRYCWRFAYCLPSPNYLRILRTIVRLGNQSSGSPRSLGLQYYKIDVSIIELLLKSNELSLLRIPWLKIIKPLVLQRLPRPSLL